MCLKNEFFLLFCSLVLILSIIGCIQGSCSTFKSIEDDKSNSMKMSYSKFNGIKFKSLKLNSGDILNLNIDVNTTSGILSIFILTEDGTEIYKIDNPQTYLSEKITIPKDGEYKIKLAADNHDGGYYIDWKVQSADF